MLAMYGLHANNYIDIHKLQAVDRGSKIEINFELGMRLWQVYPACTENPSRYDYFLDYDYVVQREWKNFLEYLNNQFDINLNLEFSKPDLKGVDMFQASSYCYKRFQLQFYTTPEVFLNMVDHISPFK